MASTRARRPRTRWLVLGLGLACSVVLPIGLHELMLSVLGVPYPSKSGVPTFVLWLNGALACFSLLVLVGQSNVRVRQAPLWARCIGVALVYAAITETFRGIVMNGVVTTAYAFNFLIAIPFVLCKLLLAFGITIVDDLPVRYWVKILLTVVLSTIPFLIEPRLERFLDLETTFASLDHAEVYAAPYGWVVNSLSTVTFIEPVVAMLATYWAVKDSLGSSMLTRLCKFTGLILLLRGPLFAFLVYGLFSKLGYAGFMLAQSQFLLEWALLAILIALTLHYSTGFRKAPANLERSPSH